MPQIAQIDATYASQLFWLLLSFGFVFFVVGLGMYPKVQGTVDDRNARITADLAAARDANRAADELEEQYRERTNADRAAAQALVAEAKAAAARSAEQRLAEADAATAARVEAAEADIAARAQAARAELETVAAEAAEEMVARLTGTPPPPGAAAAEVKAVLHG